MPVLLDRPDDGGLAAVPFAVPGDGPRGPLLFSGRRLVYDRNHEVSMGDGGKEIRLLVAPVALALALWGCSSGGGQADGGRDADADGSDGGDADQEPADGGDGGDGDALADGDAVDADEDGPPVPGPLTFVVTSMNVSTERICDLDGDGDLDNAIADLGSPAADLFALSVNSVLVGGISEGYRSVIHLPFVNDVGPPDDPEAVMLMFLAVDADDPPEIDDDFSGTEPFYAQGGCLDGCGEPLFALRLTTIDHGVLTASGGDMPFQRSSRDFIPTRDVRVSGTVDPGGAAGHVKACGLWTIPDLGDRGSITGFDTGQTALEQLLSGGAAAGVPSIPGLRLNVDLDRDGLEGFVLDEELHIARCIDGDSSLIEGRDCWQDPRMADAFAATLEIESVAAAFAGREPRWELTAVGGCDDPPEESLFDPR